MPRSYDFVVICGPEDNLLRPVTDHGRAFIRRYFNEWPKGIGQAIALDGDRLNKAIDWISTEGMRVEVL